MSVTEARAKHWQNVAEAWVETELNLYRLRLDPRFHRSMVTKIRDALADAEDIALTARLAVTESRALMGSAIEDMGKMAEQVESISRGWCCWWCRLKTIARDLWNL